MNKLNTSTKPKRHLLKVSPGGVVEFIYNDILSGLLQAGESTITRASHVEPETTPQGLKWFADLAPVDGPKLGPFDYREQALAAEVKWLEANRLRHSGGNNHAVS